MVFKCFANLYELIVSFGEFVFHLSYGHRCTNTCNDVLALCVYKELAHELLFACCGITCECNACTGVVVEVSEYHGHYVYCRTPGVRNIVVATVYVCTGVIPRTEYGADSFVELNLRIGGEVLADFGFILCFEFLCELFEVVSCEFDVEFNAFSLFHLVDELFEIFLADFHNDVGEHLDKSSVRVVNESLEFGIVVAGYHSFYNFVVKTEVEDSVHHAGHGCAGTGTNGNEKRIFEVSELLAVDLLHFCDVFHDLSHDLVVYFFAVFIIFCAGFRCYCKALRYGKSDVCHFGKVCAFTAEKFTHVGISFGEQVNILCCHVCYTSDFFVLYLNL